ncbi:MAG: addiction module protein [Methylococcaceae bacterium]|nr:addiction module protein [Methylococcaceae bacterium]
MSAALNQAIASIKSLSADERALIAHCLIASLETRQEEGVDDGWAEIAALRYSELESGKVKGLSWNELKNKVTD